MYMEVSKNSGTPKSSILIEFSNINHPFLGPWHLPGIPWPANGHVTSAQLRRRLAPGRRRRRVPSIEVLGVKVVGAGLG